MTQEAKAIPTSDNMKITRVLTLRVIQGVDERCTRLPDQYKMEVHTCHGNIMNPNPEQEHFSSNFTEALQMLINRI